MVNFAEPVTLTFIFETIGIILAISLLGVAGVKLGK
jgi:hypothetical protein